MSDKKIARELTEDELQNLLSLVDKPDSDFDDNEEVMGWVNFDAREGILTVTYQNTEGETRIANWQLTLLDSGLEVDA